MPPPVEPSGLCRRLFLPLDGSPESEEVLPVAIALANLSSGSLVSLVAHAGDSVEAVACEQYLNSVAERMTRAGVTAVCRVLHQGETSGALLNDAKADRAELILLSTRGRSRLARWLLGSVSEEIIRGSICPLLVVKANKNLRLEKILVALDGSEFSERALGSVAWLAGQAGATITLLTVCRPPIAHESPAALTARLESSALRLQQLGLVCKVQLAFGEPAATILETAREGEFDLVVLVSHGRQGRDRFWLGSVAESVMRHSERATLIWK